MHSFIYSPGKQTKNENRKKGKTNNYVSVHLSTQKNTELILVNFFLSSVYDYKVWLELSVCVPKIRSKFIPPYVERSEPNQKKNETKQRGNM